MNLLAYLMISASLIASLEANAPKQCGLRVTRSAIANSWQSSQFQQFCFHSRETGSSESWNFFHSGVNNTSAVAGFHWFLISLKQVERIRSVSIKSRDDPTYPVEFRSADIEIFASMSDLSSQLGSEHCNSGSISSVYNLNPSAWNYCGKTKSTLNRGDVLTVACDQQVRILLLRKYVATLSNPIHQCMNFVNMWLNRIDVEDPLNPTNRYKIVTENGICNTKSPNTDVRVTFESPDVSKHECSAFDSSGARMNISEETKPTCDVAGNALRSQWLCRNCNNFSNVTVRCTVDGLHQTEQLVDKNCLKKISFAAVAIAVLTVIGIVILSAAFVILFRKKVLCRHSQSAEQPAAQGHQMTVLSHVAPRKPPLPPEVAIKLLSQSQQSVQQVAAAASTYADYIDEDAENNLRLKSSECFYETVSPDQQFEPSDDSRTNSEVTVYVEIVADGLDPLHPA